MNFNKSFIFLNHCNANPNITILLLLWNGGPSRYRRRRVGYFPESFIGPWFGLMAQPPRPDPDGSDVPIRIGPWVPTGPPSTSLPSSRPLGPGRSGSGQSAIKLQASFVYFSGLLHVVMGFIVSSRPELGTSLELIKSLYSLSSLE
jgi:hypothetical protein